MASDNADMTLLPGVFIIFLTVIFGGNTVAIKLTLTGMGPLTTAGLRFALAAVAIACWAHLTGRCFRIQPGQAFQLLVVSVAFTIQLCLFYLGLERTYASRGVLISNLLPFFVLFLSHRFIPGERITWKKMMGIALGFGGVTFMFSGTPGVSRSLHGGDLIILAAVVVWSCNVVYTKRIINDYSPFHLVLYPMIFSVPIFLSAGFMWDGRMLFNLNPTVISAYVYQSLVSAAFGFVAWSTMLQALRCVHPARLCVHHAHSRRGVQRAFVKRTHHSQSYRRHGLHCRRHFDDPREPKKAYFYFSPGPGVMTCILVP